MRNKQDDSVSIKGKIKAEAFRLGFSLCGFTSPDSPEGFWRYEKWLSSGYQAGMAYLETPRHRSMRQYPDQLVPGVKTIISLAWPYALSYEKNLSTQNTAFIAGYAAGKDYHHVLPVKLAELINFLHQQINPVIISQSFTDSAPILEREIASRAGLGWIGKNSCLISPEIGSTFLLAELFIDYSLDPDQPFTEDRCGTCHRCIEACPTGCLQPDRTIDSNRCISYLTIENKGSIPEDLRPFIGKWIFGCDICQSICPWNKDNQKYVLDSTSPKWTIDDVTHILTLSAGDFSNRFMESAMFRSKLKGLQRNAFIWLGNNGNHESQILIDTFIQTTNDDALIESSNWALKKINQ